MKVRPAFFVLLLVTVALAALVGCEPQQSSPPPIAKLAAIEPTCDSVPKPVWPAMYETDGANQPGIKPTDDWMGTLEEGYVKGTWIYPDCWVKGWVPYTKIVRAPDLPSVHEPVYRPGEEPKP